MKKHVCYLLFVVMVLGFFACDFDNTRNPDQNTDTGVEETVKNITVPSSGLVGRWEMDLIVPLIRRTPGTPSYGRVNGATATYGWDANSLYFDGSDSVVVADNANIDFGTGDFSIFCLVKPTTTSSIKTILDKRESSRGYHVTIYNGKLLLQMTDGTSWANFVSTSTVKTFSNNRWHNVLITVDRSSTTGINMYIDGYRVGTFNPTPIYRSLSNSASLYIGAHSTSSASNFRGRIDKVLLYNRVLTSTEQVRLTTPGLPAYDPAIWNGGDIRSNNCYNYASNVKNNQFAQPGYASGSQPNINDTSLTAAQKITLLRNAVIADGLEPVDSNWWSMYLKKGVVALVLAHNNIWNPRTGRYESDYHFYRLNNDLVTWTHKQGQTAVSIRDASGSLIYDPQTADRGYYTHFVGYFKLWSDSVQGQGHEYIRGPL